MWQRRSVLVNRVPRGEAPPATGAPDPRDRRTRARRLFPPGGSFAATAPTTTGRVWDGPSVIRPNEPVVSYDKTAEPPGDRIGETPGPVMTRLVSVRLPCPNRCRPAAIGRTDGRSDSLSASILVKPVGGHSVGQPL
jgi:hypothetical protein